MKTWMMMGLALVACPALLAHGVGASFPVALEVRRAARMVQMDETARLGAVNGQAALYRVAVADPEGRLALAVGQPTIALTGGQGRQGQARLAPWPDRGLNGAPSDGYLYLSVQLTGGPKGCYQGQAQIDLLFQ